MEKLFWNGGGDKRVRAVVFLIAIKHQEEPRRGRGRTCHYFHEDWWCFSFPSPFLYSWTFFDFFFNHLNPSHHHHHHMFPPVREPISASPLSKENSPSDDEFPPFLRYEHIKRKSGGLKVTDNTAVTTRHEISHVEQHPSSRARVTARLQR